MKIGIIRCMQTEDYCPASTDIKYLYEKKGGFADIDSPELVAINSCGGCPGKKAVFRAREMVKRGAEAIAFASCTTNGNPIGFACPFAKKMIDAISKDLGEDIAIIDYTH